jgi:hypothetical protein
MRSIGATLISQMPLFTATLVVNESFRVSGEPRGQLFGEMSTECNCNLSSSSIAIDRFYTNVGVKV